MEHYELLERPVKVTHFCYTGPGAGSSTNNSHARWAEVAESYFELPRAARTASFHEMRTPANADLRRICHGHQPREAYGCLLWRMGASDNAWPQCPSQVGAVLQECVHVPNVYSLVSEMLFRDWPQVRPVQGLHVCARLCVCDLQLRLIQRPSIRNSDRLFLCMRQLRPVLDL